MKPTTLLDRLLIGCLCAVVGAVLVCVVALFAGLVVRSGEFNGIIVATSALYLFVVGLVKGEMAGDFAGEAIGVSASAIAATGGAAIEPKSSARTGVKTSVWLWVGYVASVALVGVLG